MFFLLFFLLVQMKTIRQVNLKDRNKNFFNNMTNIKNVDLS